MSMVDGPLSGCKEVSDRRAAVADLAAELRTLAEGWCTFGAVYEGPPMYGHGGVSAMLLDQVLGQAAAAAGHPGVTTDLTVRYRRPVPLDVPLRVWGRVTEAGGRRQVSVVGGITTADKPDVQLVEADARFYRLRPDQVRRMFGRLASPGAASPEVAHD
jgi:acyl-coenzyme A thioesterase PaaI-like protein